MLWYRQYGQKGKIMYQIFEVYNGKEIPVAGYSHNDHFTCEVWVDHLKCDHPNFEYIIRKVD